MPQPGKRYRADAEQAPKLPLPLPDAVNAIKNFKPAKFDQSVELHMHLGIDDSHADQQLRGAISLPHGIGASKKVIAFCSPEKVEAAKAAGATEAGGEELVKKIEEGWMEFDVAIAEPAMMRVVSKLGRQLGPKGLMPSPKAGTVTPKIDEAVKEFAAGKLEFRNDKGGNIHTVIGKMSFPADQLIENAQFFIDHIVRLKPSASKGQYVKNVALAATMTPSVLVAE